MLYRLNQPSDPSLVDFKFSYRDDSENMMGERGDRVTSRIRSFVSPPYFLLVLQAQYLLQTLGFPQ